MPRATPPEHDRGDFAMVTSGLVVLLESYSDDGRSAPSAIRSAPRFTVGDRDGDWLPVALEAADAVESERWHDWLRRLPGVASVEVVFVHWGDVEAEVPHADA